MSNLKTLNDIEEEAWGDGVIFVSELKAEAIKKVKLLNDHYKSCELFPFKILNDRERKVLKDYIKWENNITEEDLK